MILKTYYMTAESMISYGFASTADMYTALMMKINGRCNIYRPAAAIISNTYKNKVGSLIIILSYQQYEYIALHHQLMWFHISYVLQ